MSPKQLVPIVFTLALALGRPHAQTSWTLASPDGAVQATVQLADSGGKADYPTGVRLYYSVSLDNQVALPLSPLGITRADQDFNQGLVFDSASAPRAIDESYAMVLGKRSQCRNRAQERILSFHNAAGARLQVVLRAYAEGIAFRYVFPETNAAPLTVTGEATGFRLPAGSQGWMMAYDTVFTYRPAYEAEWNKVAAGTASPSPQGWAFPMLFQTPAGHWIFLGETEVTENYCGTHLAGNAPSLVYRIAFPAANEMQTSVPANPSWTLPWAMPWRMVMVAKTLGPIVESTLPTDLASPSVVADPSWIKPGRASWSWWSNGNSPKSYSLLTPFVDLAQQMTWEYSLVDANWNTMTGGTWQGVVDYAKAKNVGILLWYNSAGPYNAITDGPRDRINIEATRKTEFQSISQAGVKGVKIDFWMSDKQAMMKYYRDVLKDAADQKLMMNVHGCTIPRGWQRTFPNLVAAEAVKGAEEYKFTSTYPTTQPPRNAMFPFTRNVMSSMDYTPVLFSNNVQKTMNGFTYYARATSYGHELALSVVFESGIQHFADQASGYTTLPTYAMDFLKRVPAAWDDTKYLQGEPGTWVALARRKGQDWYVGCINGEATARDLAQKLGFLTPGSGYSMEMIADGATKTAFVQKIADVTAADSLKTSMLPYGGFVAYLKQTSGMAVEPRAGKGRAPVKHGAEYDLRGRKQGKANGAGPKVRLDRPAGP